MKLVKFMLAAIGVLVLSFFIALGLAAYFFVYTTKGAQLSVDYILLKLAPYASVHIDEVHGALSSGLTLKNVSVRNCPILGAAAILQVQRMDMQFDFRDPYKTNAHIFNARLILPHSEPVIFNGDYADRQIKGNIYGSHIDISDIKEKILSPALEKVIDGHLSHLDMSIDGEIVAPRITGQVYLESFRYKQTEVRQGNVSVDLKLGRAMGEWSLFGALDMQGGLVNVHQNTINLDRSHVVFLNNLDPKLDIHGFAQADIYHLDMNIAGTLHAPLLRVVSDPYLPQEQALAALGLGKWGITDFNVDVKDDIMRMQMKKRVAEDVSIGFELEQMGSKSGQQPFVSKTLLGEFSLSDNLFLDMSQTLANERSDQDQSVLEENWQRDGNESRMLLRYKNSF